MGKVVGDQGRWTLNMIVPIILLCLASVSLTDPPVFDNYFDDPIKEVDISLNSAIKACLQNGDTFADKVKAAYNDDECFGKDYDFDDLAKQANGKDSDNDGLPDKFEGNEACFYKKMGWVDAAGSVDADAVKADLVGLDAGLKGEFDENIDKCAAWDGSFGSRKKREADIPAVMEKGGQPLNWIKPIIRKTRSAEPQNGNGNGKAKGKDKKKNKKTKKGKEGNKNKKTKKGGSRKRKGGKKSGKKAKKGKRGNKNKKTKKGGSRKRKGSKKSDKKAKKGKNSGQKGNNEKVRKGNKNEIETNGSGSLDESTYNKLWCFDLSLEQILEKCVENKIKN